MSIKKAIELVGIYYGKALTLEYVHKKVAWALYQVWKIADKEKANEVEEREQKVVSEKSVNNRLK